MSWRQIIILFFIVTGIGIPVIIATVPNFKGKKSSRVFSGHLMETDIECFYQEHIHVSYRAGKTGIDECSILSFFFFGQ